MLIFLSIVAFWATCGFIARCLVLGDFTRSFPYMRHHDVCTLAWMLGIIALRVELRIGDKPLTFRFAPSAPRGALANLPPNLSQCNPRRTFR